MTEDLHKLFHRLDSLQSRSRYKLSLRLQHGYRVGLSKRGTNDVCADAEVLRWESPGSSGPCLARWGPRRCQATPQTFTKP